jgi:hypothetical protein
LCFCSLKRQRTETEEFVAPPLPLKTLILFPRATSSSSIGSHILSFSSVFDLSILCAVNWGWRVLITPQSNPLALVKLWRPAMLQLQDRTNESAFKQLWQVLRSESANDVQTAKTRNILLEIIHPTRRCRVCAKNAFLWRQAFTSASEAFVFWRCMDCNAFDSVYN